jgi:protein gp37
LCCIAGFILVPAQIASAQTQGEAIVAAARAMESHGYPYCFDGGNTAGPTVGITDPASDGSYSSCASIGKVGFDCTGLTLYAVYQGTGNAGLSHDGHQARSGGGQAIGSTSALQPGDVVYFDYNAANGLDAIDHAGIYVGGGQVLSAVSEKWGIRTESIAWYEAGGLHFVGGVRYWSASGGGGSPTLQEGEFISVTGSNTVYRMAGGAPIYVSSWSHVGGPHTVTVVSRSQFESLRQYPADGTYLSGNGDIYVVAGGAPIYVSSWEHVGGSAGKSPIVVDQSAIWHGGEGGAWNHLRQYPADGTYIHANGDTSVVVGGAPLYVSNWEHVGGSAGKSVTVVDQSAIWHGDEGGPNDHWDHLHQYPADGSLVSGNGDIYVIAGGAPLYVSNWAQIGGSSGRSVTVVDQSAIWHADEGGPNDHWNHLHQVPSNSTYLNAGGDIYVMAGGAPIYVSNWEHVGGSAGKSAISIDPADIEQAGAVASQWAHLHAFPSDGTVLQSGPGGALYETSAGAPYPITAAPAGKTAVIVDPLAIKDAGQGGRWRFLRAPSVTAPGTGTNAGGTGNPSDALAGDGGRPSKATENRGSTVRLLHVAMKGESVLVVLACDGPSGRSCRGKVELLGRKRHPSSTPSRDDRTGSLHAGASSTQLSRRVKFGENRFDLTTGSRGTVSIALDRPGRSLRDHPVQLVIVTGGKRQTVKETIGRSRADRRHGSAGRRMPTDAPRPRSRRVGRGDGGPGRGCARHGDEGLRPGDTAVAPRAPRRLQLLQGDGEERQLQNGEACRASLRRGDQPQHTANAGRPHRARLRLHPAPYRGTGPLSTGPETRRGRQRRLLSGAESSREPGIAGCPLEHESGDGHPEMRSAHSPRPSSWR